VDAVRVVSRVEITGNDEPGVKRGESVQRVNPSIKLIML